MKCKVCNSDKRKEKVIHLNKYKANAIVCNECGKLICIDCNQKEKRVFEAEYKKSLREKNRKCLDNKFLILNIREVRKNKEITNKDIAEITGITEQRLSKIEKEGINIRITTIFKIAYVLRCSVDELVYYIDKNEYIKDKHVLVIE